MGGKATESLIESGGCADLDSACQARGIQGSSALENAGSDALGAQSIGRGADRRCRESLERQNVQIPANRPLFRILAQSRKLLFDPVVILEVDVLFSK